MPNTLPSIRALSCFVAVADAGSVSRAAEQLNMTPSAVSRQIHSLELILGCELFDRERQRLRLNSTGARYLERVGTVLDQLQQATDEIRVVPGGKVVLALEPALATRWLIPHLESFVALHPKIDLQLLTDMDKIYPISERFDLGILFGGGDWDGAQSQVFMDDSLLVVCIPRLKQAGVKRFADILNYPIIHHAGPFSTSRSWLAKAGLSDSEILRLGGPRLTTFELVLQVALQGLGVAILPSYYVSDAIRSGELVEAAELRLACDEQYHVVINATRRLNTSVKATAQWLSSLPVPPVC